MALGSASTILPSRVIVSSGMCSHQFTNEWAIVRKLLYTDSSRGDPLLSSLCQRRAWLCAGGTLRLADCLLALNSADLTLRCKPALLSDDRQDPSLSNSLAEPLQQAILGFAWAKFNTHLVTPLRQYKSAIAVGQIFQPPNGQWPQTARFLL